MPPRRPKPTLLSAFLGGENSANFRHFATSSSETNSDLIRRTLLDGASGFVPKSSSRQVMRSAIKMVIDGGVFLPPEAIGQVASVAAESSRTISLSERQISLLSSSGLTPREIEVLTLLAAGLSNKEIARELDISEATVKAHVTKTLAGMGVRSRSQAVFEVTQGRFV